MLDPSHECAAQIVTTAGCFSSAGGGGCHKGLFGRHFIQRQDTRGDVGRTASRQRTKFQCGKLWLMRRGLIPCAVVGGNRKNPSVIVLVGHLSSWKRIFHCVFCCSHRCVRHLQREGFSARRHLHKTRRQRLEERKPTAGARRLALAALQETLVEILSESWKEVKATLTDGIRHKLHSFQSLLSCI